MVRELNRRHVVAGLAAAATIGLRPVTAAEPIRLVSHRTPTTEHFVGRMQSAVPGTTVDAQLVPFDRAVELTNLALSSKSSNLDLLFVNDSSFLPMAKNGWLRPLNAVWEKLKGEFDLGDFSDAAMKALTYQGNIYALPMAVNPMIFFYRSDLLSEAKQQPPETIEAYLKLAKQLNSPMRAGTISCLRPTDATISEAHWYLNALADGWFDDKWEPVFNNARGVSAIERLKEASSYAQRGFATSANDECMIALQQDTAAMGLQWTSRAAAMDDTKQSRVVGKMMWAPAPSGGARFTTEAYAISAFSKQDPEVLFRILATATNRAGMDAVAGKIVPPRSGALNDPTLKDKSRYIEAAAKSVQTSKPYPQLPEFNAVGGLIARRIVQAATGEMPVKVALDTAAQETRGYLKERGYY